MVASTGEEQDKHGAVIDWRVWMGSEPPAVFFFLCVCAWPGIGCISRPCSQ